MTPLACRAPVPQAGRAEPFDALVPSLFVSLAPAPLSSSASRGGLSLLGGPVSAPAAMASRADLPLMGPFPATWGSPSHFYWVKHIQRWYYRLCWK